MLWPPASPSPQRPAPRPREDGDTVYDVGRQVFVFKGKHFGSLQCPEASEGKLRGCICRGARRSDGGSGAEATWEVSCRQSLGHPSFRPRTRPHRYSCACVAFGPSSWLKLGRLRWTSGQRLPIFAELGAVFDQVVSATPNNIDHILVGQGPPHYIANATLYKTSSLTIWTPPNLARVRHSAGRDQPIRVSFDSKWVVFNPCLSMLTTISAHFRQLKIDFDQIRVVLGQIWLISTRSCRFRPN